MMWEEPRRTEPEPIDEDLEHPPTCRLGWLIDEIGRYLTDDDKEYAQADEVGRQAVVRGAQEANELLRSAYHSHEVVASELRIVGTRRGQRRTVFADMPTPMGLLLLGLRLCDAGDEVSILHHTAGQGTTTRAAVWPFGMAEAEEITRPPVPRHVDLPDP